MPVVPSDPDPRDEWHLPGGPLADNVYVEKELFDNQG